MKRTLIVANWKMHLNTSQASLLLHRLHERIKIHRDIEIVLSPSMLVLQPLSLQIDRRKFRLAAQNAFHKDEGAYTGEVSFTMLQDLVHYVIVGHSDRRYKFGEGLDTVRDKVAAAVRNGIVPILCVGETKNERLQGETMQVLHDQVVSAVSNLTSREIHDIVIAYEPVWALSSGTDYLHHEIPKPGDIAKAVVAIRNDISELYGKKASESVRVLYGGSSSASTARGLMEVEGIDGLLVGGASLNYHEFSGIVDGAYRMRRAEEG
ncbi:triose-phosphate isomerase [Candidatus Saccharibacteria bacterium]|nr:triose-phosphate isomerase [Candidatus Saccharibacteria bacterium]MBI3338247.1 triose-phosphate isomerase [Candidatus Saccharibacteria bacterium]